MGHTINFNVKPSDYKHWKIKIENNIGYLIFDVDEDRGLIGDYKLKLNSMTLVSTLNYMMLCKDLDLNFQT